MDSSTFRYSSPYINERLGESFNGTYREKQELRQITNEWNTRSCMTGLFNKWSKSKPINNNSNPTFLL